MRKVKLRMKEQYKYDVIKDLYDHKGNKLRAAQKLGITVRQVNRLLKIYQEKGKAGFIHGNRNRQSVNSLPQELIDNIVNLYTTKYQDFNFAHFTDKLNEDEGINVSYGTVYNILTAHGFSSPKIHKATKRKRAREKLLANKPNIDQKDLEEAISHEVALADSHPRKERSKYFGERVEMDGSIHLWFGKEKSTLHLAIDHASGNILGGYFDKEETLNGYYHVFKQILTDYGIPALFFTDNRTVFNYQKDSFKSDHKDVLTQFGYACKTLGVSLETSSVSQAKGMIERANGTFQGRLVNELKLNGITDIDAANKYLIDVFIPDFNKRFAMDISSFDSVMEDSPSQEQINLTLAVISHRKINNGSSISYQAKTYMVHNENDELVCFKPKQECLVIKAFDGSLFLSVDESVYILVELEKNAKVSPNFDDVDPKPKEKKRYTPPMNHPWRIKLFEAQKQRAHNLRKYGF